MQENTKTVIRSHGKELMWNVLRLTGEQIVSIASTMQTKNNQPQEYKELGTYRKFHDRKAN